MNRDYEAVIEFFKSAFPQVYRESAQLRRESVQVVTWLVGFSVAMGALLLTGLEKMPYLGAAAFRATIAMLALAIFAGVLHRIVYHYAEGKTLSLVQGLYGHLGGFLVGARATGTEPSEVIRVLASLVGPYMNLSEEEAFKHLMAGNPEETRRKARVAGRLHRIADGLYYLTSAAFMLAVVVLTWNLLHHQQVNKC